jgi:hypothetical protein
MITFDQADKLDILPNQLNNRPGATILENLTAGYDSGKYSGGAGANSDFMTAQEIWGPILDELKTNGLDVEDPTMFLYTSFLSGDFANHSAYQKQLRIFLKDPGKQRYASIGITKSYA